MGIRPSHSLNLLQHKVGGNGKLWRTSQMHRYLRRMTPAFLPTPVVRFPYPGDVKAWVADMRPAGLHGTPRFTQTGFGMVAVEDCPGVITGHGHLFCTRIFMTDPASRIAVDSHLRIHSHDDLLAFNQYFITVRSALAAFGFNFESARCNVLYGIANHSHKSVAYRIFDAPGRRVAEMVQQQGIIVDAIIPIFEADAAHDIMLQSGALVAVRNVSRDNIADNYGELVGRLADVLGALRAGQQVDHLAASTSEILEALYDRIPRAQKPRMRSDVFYRTTTQAYQALEAFAHQLRQLSIGPYIVHREEIDLWLSWIS